MTEQNYEHQVWRFRPINIKKRTSLNSQTSEWDSGYHSFCKCQAKISLLQISLFSFHWPLTLSFVFQKHYQSLTCKYFRLLKKSTMHGATPPKMLLSATVNQSASKTAFNQYESPRTTIKFSHPKSLRTHWQFWKIHNALFVTSTQLKDASLG